MTDIIKIDGEEYYAKDVAHYEIAVKNNGEWKHIFVGTNGDFGNEDYVLGEYEFIEDYLEKLKKENEDAFIISTIRLLYYLHKQNGNLCKLGNL